MMYIYIYIAYINISNHIFFQFDDSYLPYDVIGPVHTPPIENYDTPDGEYIETTIKYAGE